MRGRQGTRQTWKSLSTSNIDTAVFKGIFCVVLISIMLGISGCKSNTRLTNVKIYKASSQQEAIVRAQAQEAIACSDPSFDDYFCMSSSDITAVIKKLKSCSSKINLRSNKDYALYEKDFKQP